MLDVFYIDDMRDAPRRAANFPGADCYTFVARLRSDDPEVAFREFNVVMGDEIPCDLHARSLSVGDVVLVHGDALLCAGVGFVALPLAVAEALAIRVPPEPVVYTCRHTREAQ